MVLSRSALVLLAIASSALGVAINARTPEQLQADIADLTTRVTTLDNDITAFPDSGGSILAALGIHTDATNVDSTLKTATSEASSTDPLSEEDGQAVLAQIQTLQPIIVHALDTIVAKKPAFEGLPIGGLTAVVKQDIAVLSNDTKAFEDALVAIAPADVLEQAQEVIVAIDDAFAAAAAAYA